MSIEYTYGFAVAFLATKEPNERQFGSYFTFQLVVLFIISSDCLRSNRRLTHRPTATKMPPIRFLKEKTCERNISITIPENTCPVNKNNDR